MTDWLSPEWSVKFRLASFWANAATSVVSATLATMSEFSTLIFQLIPFVPEEGPWRTILVFLAVLLFFFGTNLAARFIQQPKAKATMIERTANGDQTSS